MARAHRWLLLVLALDVLVRLPMLANVEPMVVLNQDYNPVHFGELLYGADTPAVDDSEVGENADRLALSTAGFWVPAVLHHVVGLPYDVWIGAHLLLVVPALLLAIYALAHALSRDRRVALAAALLFFAGDLILFRANVGIEYFANHGYYYDDLLYPIAVGGVALLVARRWIGAGLMVALLALVHPTSAVCSAIVLGGTALPVLRDRGAPERKQAAIGLAAGAAGLLGALVQVRLASPLAPSAPADVRDIAIRTYTHIAPHAFRPSQFLIGTLALGVGLVAAASYERRRQDADPTAARVLTAAVVMFVGLGVVGYWTTFVFAPSLFVMIGAAKAHVLAVFLLLPYVALGIAHLGARARLARAARPVVLVALAVLAVLAVPVALALRSTVSGSAAIGTAVTATAWLAAAALALIASRLAGDDSWRRATGANVALVTTAVVGGAWLLIGTLGLYEQPRLDAARSLVDLEHTVDDRLPADAVLLMAPPPGGESRNPFHPFGSIALRTYSHRGAIVYWSLGRNAFFDSRERHRAEVRAFGAAGIDVWGDLRSIDRSARRDRLAFHTGIDVRTSPCCGIDLSPTPLYRGLEDEIDRLEQTVDAMSMRELAAYAEELGATHLVFGLDPDHHLRAPEPVIANDWFAVVAVDDVLDQCTGADDCVEITTS